MLRSTHRNRIGIALFASCLFLPALSAVPTSTLAQVPASISLNHKLAMYSLPAVVRTFGGWKGKFLYKGKEYTPPPVYATGSGFFVHPSGYIVTNAHNVMMLAKGIDGAAEYKEALIRGFIAQLEREEDKKPGTIAKNAELFNQVWAATQPKFEPIQFIRVSGDRDYIYEIKKVGDETGVGSRKDVAILKVEVRDAPCLKLGDSDGVQLVDHILLMGYPGAGDSESNLDERSMLIASVTDGLVSAVKSTPVGTPILQVSAPATHGNSGGPVINERGEVVGILTFRGNLVQHQEVSGFSFAVTSNTIQEFLNETGIKLDESKTDQLYRKGLDLMWSGNYLQARNYFTEVKGLYPEHSEVDRLINLCSHNISTPVGINPNLIAGQKNGTGTGKSSDKSATTNNRTSTSTNTKKN